MRCARSLLALLLGVVALLATGGDGAGMPQAATRAKRSDRVGLGTGFRPPAFSAQDLDGAEHTLEAHQGNVLVLHFWASWCPYCRAEIPKLRELQERWTSRGVRVLTVSIDTDLEALKRFRTEQRLPYPVIAAAGMESSVAEQYGVSGIPVTYVIGKDGRIFARLNGSSDIVGTVRSALQSSSGTL